MHAHRLFSLVIIALVALAPVEEVVQPNRRSAEAMTVYFADGLTRIRPDDPPPSNRTALIKAARNEHEPFQVVIRAGDRGLNRVDLHATDLTGSRGRRIAASKISFFREHYVEVSKPTPRSREGAGLYPDALIPLTKPADGTRPGAPRFVGAPFDVSPNRSQPVWVDVFVPKDTPPGDYQAALTVTAKGASPTRVRIHLTVWPFTLPETPTMRSNFGGFGQRVATIHGVEPSSSAFRIIERRYAEAMAAHRICPPIPSYLYPTMKADGSIDASANHKALKEWIDRFHVTGFPLDLPGRDPLGADRDRAIRYLRAMYAYLKESGWEKLAYIYVLDEPNDAEAYQQVRRRAKLIHDAQPGIKVLCTEQPTPENPAWGTLVGSVDIWVPLWPLYEEKDGDKRLAAGEEVWSYTALCQGKEETPFWEIDFPLLNYRIPGWLSYRYRMTGLLYWTTVYWEKTPDAWTDPNTYNGFNGEGSLFYPGTAIGYDGPVPSIRLEQIREGLEDYEYMRLLEKRRGRSFVEGYVQRIARAWTDWDRDPKKLYAVREEIAREITRARVTDRTTEPSSAPRRARPIGGR